MRYKAKPEREDFYPIKVDITDLEALLEHLPDATLTIETERCVFDGLEDVMKNMRRPTRIDKLILTFATYEKGRVTLWPSKIALVPYLITTGERAAIVEPEVKTFLRNMKRSKARHAPVAIVVGVLAAVALIASAKNPSSPFVIMMDAMTAMFFGLAAFLIADFSSNSIIVPTKKEISFLRRHAPTWLSAIVLTTIGALITAWATYHWSK